MPTSIPRFINLQQRFHDSLSGTLPDGQPHAAGAAEQREICHMGALQYGSPLPATTVGPCGIIGCDRGASAMVVDDRRGAASIGLSAVALQPAAP